MPSKAVSATIAPAGTEIVVSAVQLWKAYAPTYVSSASDSHNEFVRNLYAKYSKDKDYGGRSLNEGLLELRIELANYISFSVYCQKIEVIKCDI